MFGEYDTRTGKASQPPLPNMPGDLGSAARHTGWGGTPGDQAGRARRRRKRIQILAWVIVLSTVATIIVSVVL
jgi:hypothetical protein